MQFTLGAFIFSLNTVTPNSVTRSTNSRWASNNGVGKEVRPSYQAIGLGEDVITFDGVVYPECFSLGSEVSLEGLRWMMDDQTGWYLIRGDGLVVGVYKIDNLEETHTYLNQDGTARKIAFSIKLTRLDESGSLLGSLNEALDTGLL